MTYPNPGLRAGVGLCVLRANAAQLPGLARRNAARYGLVMLRYIAQRLISLSLTLVVASVIIFAVIEVIPGDPAAFMLGLNATPEAIAALREDLGLGGSLVERYLGWIGGMFRGDFGTSYTYRVPVSELVLDRLWIPLPLPALALILSGIGLSQSRQLSEFLSPIGRAHV